MHFFPHQNDDSFYFDREHIASSKEKYQEKSLCVEKFTFPSIGTSERNAVKPLQLEDSICTQL